MPIRNITFSIWDWQNKPDTYAIAVGIYHAGHLCFFTNGAGKFGGFFRPFVAGCAKKKLNISINFEISRKKFDFR